MRLAAITRLLSVGASIRAAGPTDALVASTGLTKEGVAFALDRCLETSASPAELEAFVARATPAAAVAVILASNVFVGALRAIAFARAGSARVVVRPSRRDPELARRIVREAGDPGITLDEAFEVPSLAGGEIHVYGRDETIAEVRANAQPGVVVRGHGSGMGMAWVEAAADIDDAAGRLADDVVVLDQRGCLSPRVVLVEGAGARGAAFARALDGALASLGARIPRGALTIDERAASRRYIETMAVAGELLEGQDHVVGIAPEGAPLVVPPTHRHVHVATATSLEAAARLAAPLARALTVVGTGAPQAATALAPHARSARLGEMQTPPFDGPVDLRGFADVS